MILEIYSEQPISTCNFDNVGNFLYLIIVSWFKYLGYSQVIPN